MIAPIEISPSSTPGQIKIIRVTQNARKQVVFNLTDDSGSSVNLWEEVENPPADDADFSPQPAAARATVSLRLTSRSGDLYGNQAFNVPGAVLDQVEHPGYVEFILKADDTNRPGVFEATVERYIVDGGDGIIVDTWPALIAVEPAAMALLDSSPQGPLLIPEVRLAMLDIDDQSDGAPFSSLLDDAEFTDLDIIAAQRRVVQLWNETPPPVAMYTLNNFPYRYWWLQGTIATLFISGAARYRRNRLAYSAGGMSIDDQSKSKEYEEAGHRTRAEFLEWMRVEKYRINMNAAWGIGL